MKVVKIFILILWMSLIFFFSSQDGNDSSKLSSGFITNTVTKVYKLFNNNVNNEEVIEKYSFYVRKCAHMTEYLILFILIYII